MASKQGLPRTIRWLRVAGVLGALVTTSGFATRSGTSPSRATPVTKPHFTTADILRGVVFADGPLAERIPELRNAGLMRERIQEPLVRAAVSRMIDRIISVAEVRDSAALAEFAALMRSGNPIKVEAGLSIGAKALREASAQLAEVKLTRLAIQDDPSKLLQMRERALLDAKRSHAAGDSVGAARAMDRVVSLGLTYAVENGEHAAKSGDKGNWIISLVVCTGILWFGVLQDIWFALNFIEVMNIWDAVFYQVFVVDDVYFWVSAVTPPSNESYASSATRPPHKVSWDKMVYSLSTTLSN